MAGHRSRHRIEPFAQRQRLIEGGEFVRQIGDQPRRIGLTEQRRRRAHQHRGRPEPFEIEAELGEFVGPRFEPVAGRLLQLDDLGDQQRLRRDPPTGKRGAHPFEHQPFMRGMLVDEHQPVLRLGDDIGLGDLPARDAERMRRGLRRRRPGRFRTCGGRRGEEGRPIVAHAPGERLSFVSNR